MCFKLINRLNEQRRVKMVLALYHNNYAKREGCTAFEAFEEAYCNVYGLRAINFDVSDWYENLSDTGKRAYQKYERKREISLLERELSKFERSDLMKVTQNMGPNIKLRLKNKGIEQKELARIWGITSAATSKLLAGERKIDTEKAFAAADFLGCSVYDLIIPVIPARIGDEELGVMNEE